MTAQPGSRSCLAGGLGVQDAGGAPRPPLQAATRRGAPAPLRPRARTPPGRGPLPRGVPAGARGAGTGWARGARGARGGPLRRAPAARLWAAPARAACQGAPQRSGGRPEAGPAEAGGSCRRGSTCRMGPPCLGAAVGWAEAAPAVPPTPRAGPSCTPACPARLLPAPGWRRGVGGGPAAVCASQPLPLPLPAPSFAICPRSRCAAGRRRRVRRSRRTPRVAVRAPPPAGAAGCPRLGAARLPRVCSCLRTPQNAQKARFSRNRRN
jgi:hypothetical protein